MLFDMVTTGIKVDGYSSSLNYTAFNIYIVEESQLTILQHCKSLGEQVNPTRFARFELLLSHSPVRYRPTMPKKTKGSKSATAGGNRFSMTKNLTLTFLGFFFGFLIF